MSRQFNYIKVEPIYTSHNFFEEGDLVFAKCKNSPAWPAVIRNFKGFDEEDVQVFTVDFMGTKDYAYMESYLLTPLSQKRIQKMKFKYRQNKYLYKALIKAERELTIMKQFCQMKTNFLDRFLRIYETDNHPDSHILVDADQPLKLNTKFKSSIQPLAGQKSNAGISSSLDIRGYKQQTQDYKRSRLTFWQDYKLNIQITTAIRQETKQKMIKIIINDIVWIRYSKFLTPNTKTKLIYLQVNKIEEEFVSKLVFKRNGRRLKSIENVINYISVEIQTYT